MTSLRWLTFLLVSLTVTLPVLLICIYLFEASICSTIAFLPWGILIMSSQKAMPLFIAQLITILILIGAFICICDHFGNIPSEDIFKLSAYVAAIEFCEWVHVGLHVYIPTHKYQVKLHSFPRLSATCSAAVTQRNNVFRLYQRNKSYESGVKFREASTYCKRVFEAAVLPL